MNQFTSVYCDIPNFNIADILGLKFGVLGSFNIH